MPHQQSISRFTAFVFLALASLLISPNRLAAHPHVFIDNSVRFVFDDKGLAGVRINWVFDDMFGTMIKEDFDTDSDGILSPAEVEQVRSGAFSNLARFSWFTFLEVNGAPFPIKAVSDFDAGFREGRLYYDFFVPSSIPSSNGPTSVLLRCQDPEYYAELYTPEEHVPALDGGEAFEASSSVTINPDKPYSAFQVWGTDIQLTFSGQ